MNVVEFNIIQIYPLDGQHICDTWCVCDPIMIYKDELNGNEVWEHKKISWQ